ncbi:hypothetical protein JCM33374_g2757 [Metschnikowia sp. JCM 33374]|nr:hypothetical protein JCM33374_g2757 [Metschnikowia sp. JCM 33374]
MSDNAVVAFPGVMKMPRTIPPPPNQRRKRGGVRRAGSKLVSCFRNSKIYLPPSDSATLPEEACSTNSSQSDIATSLDFKDTISLEEEPSKATGGVHKRVAFCTVTQTFQKRSNDSRRNSIHMFFSTLKHSGINSPGIHVPELVSSITEDIPTKDTIPEAKAQDEQPESTGGLLSGLLWFLLGVVNNQTAGVNAPEKSEFTQIPIPVSAPVPLIPTLEICPVSEGRQTSKIPLVKTIPKPPAQGSTIMQGHSGFEKVPVLYHAHDTNKARSNNIPRTGAPLPVKSLPKPASQATYSTCAARGHGIESTKNEKHHHAPHSKVPKKSLQTPSKCLGDRSKQNPTVGSKESSKPFPKTRPLAPKKSYPPKNGKSSVQIRIQAATNPRNLTREGAACSNEKERKVKEERPRWR